MSRHLQQWRMDLDPASGQILQQIPRVLSDTAAPYGRELKPYYRGHGDRGEDAWRSSPRDAQFQVAFQCSSHPLFLLKLGFPEPEIFVRHVEFQFYGFAAIVHDELHPAVAPPGEGFPPLDQEGIVVPVTQVGDHVNFFIPVAIQS